MEISGEVISKAADGYLTFKYIEHFSFLFAVLLILLTMGISMVVTVKILLKFIKENG